jgi:hypothetical protein
MQRTFALLGLLAAAFGASLVLTNPSGAQGNGGWGTIKGQVVWQGPIPKRATLNVNKDQNHCLEKGPLLSEELIVDDKTNGVRDVFVWLAAPTGQKLPIHPDLAAPKEAEVVMDQPCCQFIPHALAMREGQTLVAKNSSPIAHNSHWTGHPLKNPGGNVIVPAKGEHKIVGLKADRIPVKVTCDIHPWMSAWVRVYDHPYYAVTGPDGTFEIKNAPAGSYQMIAWHEKPGWVLAGGRDGMPIKIEAGGTTDAGKITMK